jgi:nucleoside-diphosphate-sugar epimerase
MTENSRINAVHHSETMDLGARESGPLAIPRSKEAIHDAFIMEPDDRILVTGAAGFIGVRVVESLLAHGFRNLVCFVRPSSDLTHIEGILEGRPEAKIDVIKGNLLSRTDCEAACKDVSLILHLAAGTGEKSFPNAFMNSVVTTRNLLEATIRCARLRRFVLVSSFAVYSNRQKSRCLDESCPLEERPSLRDAYCYAKVKQEQIVAEYAKKFEIPYVVVRPGSVYGGGKSQITGRVGLGTFGFFLHLGGSNIIPLTYVENCAEAIVLAGLIGGVEGEAFNVVDDNLPSSRQFLGLYKKNVRYFKSFYVPRSISYAICYFWEGYSRWSKGQLPPAFSRSRWYSEWKRTHYSNDKLKRLLGWRAKVSTPEGLTRYFKEATHGGHHA